MKVKEYINEERKEELFNKIQEHFNRVLEVEIEDLSNNDLSFIKDVALSSIMSAKRSGYNKYQILDLDGTHKGPLTEEQRQRARETKTKNIISKLTPEDLAKFGLKLI